MNNKWSHVCIPKYAVKLFIKICINKKIASSALDYITRTLCLISHKIIYDSVKSVINEKKYVIDSDCLILPFKNSNFITIDPKSNDIIKHKIDQINGLDRWTTYIRIIKNDVIQTMDVNPNKHIKLTKSAKELIVYLCLHHIYKMTTLIQSCQSLICGKIIQLRTINMIYTIWMTLDGILHKDILKFHIDITSD